ncbi:hypothetical protein H4Q26_001699 [Puccinia striiformis f. sp. tritici PST-130]|nr:hypothetical protein H4Q26_001699 [Puccinia striiformis f. sp. tritici PST-130]
MEIINPNLIPLSAFETVELLRGIKSDHERIEREEEERRNRERNLNQEPNNCHHNRTVNNLDELIHNLLTHFEDPKHNLPQPKQTKESILSLCESLRNRFGQVSGRFTGLTKAERLQICDLAPTELVEIYLIIEECDSRFTEEEIQSIIEIVKENLTNERRTTSSTQQKANQGLMNGHKDEEMYEYGEDPNFNLGDVDDDDALVAEAREGGPAPDQELDEVPD